MHTSSLTKLLLQQWSMRLSLLCCAAMQITFEGKLYITDKHTCFHAAAEQQDSSSPSSTTSSSSSSTAAGPKRTPRHGRKMPQLTFKIAHADVASATREPNPARSASGSRGLASDLLKVVVQAKGSGSSSSSSSSGPIRAAASPAAAAGGTAAAAAAGAEGLGFSSRWSVMFQSFEPSSGLDGALALIEHLREG
jgi:hypothetical protein